MIYILENVITWKRELKNENEKFDILFFNIDYYSNYECASCFCNINC